jgi:hypothetical protein
MNTPPSRLGAEPTDGSSVQIGALVPLTRPGWVEAGRHLLAGLELAVREVNDAGGIVGRPLELVVRDTAADPHRAAAAADELARLGVAALAGEYHSVVARAAAGRADALGLPFLCTDMVVPPGAPRDGSDRAPNPSTHIHGRTGALRSRPVGGRSVRGTAGSRGAKIGTAAPFAVRVGDGSSAIPVERQ